MSLRTRILMGILIAILAILAVRSIAYGISFIGASDDILREFDYDPSLTPRDEPDDAVRTLVKVFGVLNVGLTAFTALAGWMIIRRNQLGLWFTFILGGTHLLLAVGFLGELAFDAIFYGITGILLILLAGILWKPMPASPPTPSTAPNP